MPKNYTIKEDLLKEINNGKISKANLEEIESMMRRFILINTPLNYL